jgi:hypothetical protein
MSHYEMNELQIQGNICCVIFAPVFLLHSYFIANLEALVDNIFFSQDSLLQISKTGLGAI